jgi:hypothetical protein
MMNTTHAIGWKANDFAIQGIDGRTYSLAEIRAKRHACDFALFLRLGSCVRRGLRTNATRRGGREMLFCRRLVRD